MYDVVSGRETFTETTKRIATYMSREYPHAAEYRVAIMKLELVELTEPELHEAQDNKFAFKMWKLARSKNLDTSFLL